MQELKTNTAVRIPIGPFLDAADALTPKLALTVTDCSCEFFARANNGGAVTRTSIALTASGGDNDMIHVSGDTVGMYDLELTASQLNFLGEGVIVVIDSDVHLPVFETLRVITEKEWDRRYGSGAAPGVGGITAPVNIMTVEN